MIGSAAVRHFSSNQCLHAKMPYDAKKDAVAMSRRASCRRGVVGAQHVRAQTLGDSGIAWAKARAHGITIGSPGPCMSAYLSGALFSASDGLKAVHGDAQRPAQAAAGGRSSGGDSLRFR